MVGIPNEKLWKRICEFSDAQLATRTAVWLQNNLLINFSNCIKYHINLTVNTQQRIDLKINTIYEGTVFFSILFVYSSELIDKGTEVSRQR